jgi:hypothetical protein
MAEVAKFFDSIDIARVQRVKELSEIKRAFINASSNDPFSVASKAVIVLTYANWEGFYNECARIYLDFLAEAKTRVADAGWLMLTGALSAEFDALRSRNHSAEAKREFVAKLQARVTCGFDDFDRSVVMARSNLDFAKISANFKLLNFETSPLQKFRIRLDKELVGWRHGVAHGDPPDLTSVDIAGHVDFAAGVLLALSNLFQEAILDKSGT